MNIASIGLLLYLKRPAKITAYKLDVHIDNVVATFEDTMNRRVVLKYIAINNFT